MRQIPILFSTPMVQALLDGRKSMTRREVKMYAFSDAHPARQNAKWLQENKTCPYGEIGDILWVRESFCFVMLDHAPDLLEGMDSQFVFKSSVHPDWMIYAKEKYIYKWKPSIHMPKKVCRLWLKITNVRVERLKDISMEDSIHEGINALNDHSIRNVPTSVTMYKDYLNDSNYFERADYSFASLWESINGADSWDANPWVWVIEFERVERT